MNSAARHQERTAPLPQPSALTTPIGHDTSVPWSGQYPYGFLASGRYPWCQRYLPEVGFAPARHEFRADSAAGLRAVRTRPGRLQETANPMPADPAPSMEVMR
jgi:hypothetical protein